MNDLLEILKSSFVMSFYIKFSIYFISLEVNKEQVERIANKMGYERRKRVFSDFIKSIIFILILFVPYVGWTLTILVFLGLFVKDKKESIINSNLYKKKEHNYD